MKILVELMGYKNKTLIMRTFTIEQAHVADFSLIVDEMITASKDKKRNLQSIPSALTNKKNA